MEIVLPIRDILGLVKEHKEPNEAVRNLSLSLKDIIEKLLSDVDTYNEAELVTLGEIIFNDNNYKTYVEIWDEYNYLLKQLNNNILLSWLYTYKPGKINVDCMSIALSWLLCNKYDGINFENLTKEKQEELYDTFNNHDGDIPEEIQDYKNKVHFKNELLEFEDTTFLYDQYTFFNLDKDEVLPILKQIVINRKIDDLNKLNIFLTLVNWFAPKNELMRNHKTAFVLEVFEASDDSGIESWSEEAKEVWKEKFYNIDFDFNCSELVKEQIKSVNEHEANHIRNITEKYPNYRHD